MKQSYTATEEQLDMARRTGRMICPVCESNMRYLEAPQSGKHEYYCEKCHVSIPAFIR